MSEETKKRPVEEEDEKKKKNKEVLHDTMKDVIDLISENVVVDFFSGNDGYAEDLGIDNLVLNEEKLTVSFRGETFRLAFINTKCLEKIKDVVDDDTLFLFGSND